MKTHSHPEPTTQSAPASGKVTTTTELTSRCRAETARALFRHSLILSLSLALIAGLSMFASARASNLAADTNFRAPFFAKPLPPERALLLPDGKFLLFFDPDTLTDQRTGALTRFLPDGTLDTTFNFSRGYKQVRAVASAGNGKLYVAATRYAYGTKETEQILRLNSDGSIDPSFTPAIIASPADNQNFVWSIYVQPDAKILAIGYFTTVSGIPRNDIVRLLSDGTVDSNFTPPAISGGEVYGITLQPDNKILIGGSFSSVGGGANLGVARLNSDGSLDSSFKASGFARNSTSQKIRGLLVQSDGKIVMSCQFRIGTGGATKRVPLFRLNADGSPDATFTLVTDISSAATGRELVLQTDGKIIGTVSNSVYRFNTDGSRDTSFRQPVMPNNTVPFAPPGTPITVNLLPDGRILVGGTFTDVDPSGPLIDLHYGVARLNSDGTLDSSLTTSHKTGVETAPSSFARLADGSTLVGFTDKIDPAIPYNVARLLPDGSRDAAFTLSSTNPNSFLSGGFLASGFRPLPDGAFFVFGSRADQSFAYGKVLPDGKEDTAYAAQLPALSFPDVLVAPDGRVLISAGTDAQSILFSLLRLKANGQADTLQLPDSIPSGHVIRFSDGTLDQIYVGNKALAVQSDGKILFEYFSSDKLFHLVRLNVDGSRDVNFAETKFTPFDLTQNFPVVYDPLRNQTLQPPGGVWTASYPVLDAHIQPDGRIVLAGQFKSFNGTPAPGMVRLKPDGTIDNTFNPGGGAQWTQTTETATNFPRVDNLELQADGKILISGTFEAFNGVAAPGIASLNPDGSVDTSFVAPATREKYSRLNATLARQPDGSILLSGPYRFPNETTSQSLIGLIGQSATAVNISTRMAVGTGENVLIAGFIVTGNAPKKVILRAIGPSLSTGGTPVPGRLQDTVLELHAGDGSLLKRNDDWRSDQEQEIIDSTIPLTDNRESAIVATLQPGNYTAILSGKDNTTGIGLVEVYDLDTAATSELAQISTRGFVQMGDNVMIGGFIVSGSGSTKVLVRAIGPTLAQAGVNGPLQDTVLELFNGNGTTIALNDDWKSDQPQEIIDTTVPPKDDRESAILRSLNPGSYTAIVRGKGNTTGVALVEVYVLH